MRVLTLGTFDLFHIGHLRLLERCAGMAGEDGEVWVAVNGDEFVESYKGRTPVIPAESRLRIVEACKYVTGVVLNPSHEAQASVIDAVHPHAIVVGDDWRDRDYVAQIGVTQEWLDERGIRIVYVPRTPGISTTSIRRIRFYD